ncbi:hypothetical protein CTAYLR_009391 [Chrysophaeum taylorii]|uniref:Large ribosomal subunit protein uL11m n=1 Tax=Chrysophaeum taylorii TaxID=2483200 RepID=A0AAD7XSJ0_9STRA|nr:hypothetical protein CTAYLR_009391 [Chrysophaeum taylorii]
MAGVKAVVRLRCPAGAAKPGPSIGQALGPHGLNMMEFVKAFNAATQSLPPETPVPVVLTAYNNRTFTFVTKTPPASYLIRQQLGLQKGSKHPGTISSGTIRWNQIREIATVKQADKHLAHIPFESLCKSIAGTAQSMGIDVAQDDDHPAEEQGTSSA